MFPGARIANVIANQETKAMKLAEVREKAFAMPLQRSRLSEGAV